MEYQFDGLDNCTSSHKCSIPRVSKELLLRLQCEQENKMSISKMIQRIYQGMMAWKMITMILFNYKPSLLFHIWLTLQSVSCFQSTDISNMKTKLLLINSRINTKMKNDFLKPSLGFSLLKCPLWSVFAPTIYFTPWVKRGSFRFVTDVEHFFQAESAFISYWVELFSFVKNCPF